MTPDQVEDMLTEIADTITAEPDLRKRAALVGTFRHSTTRHGQQLLASTGYLLRDQRVNLNDVADLLRARRTTINAAVLDYCHTRGLKPPRGFTQATIDLGSVVALPPRKGE